MEYLIVFLPLFSAFISGFFGTKIGDKNNMPDCIFDSFEELILILNEFKLNLISKDILNEIYFIKK